MGVLIDWRMPGMDGLETIRRMQENDRIPSLPTIVMVSAYSIDELRKGSKNLPIDSFLTKPVSPSLLLDTIMNALGKKAEQQFCPLHPRSTSVWGKEFGGRRILLVDDDAINRQVALEILESAGIQVVSAVNGEEAVTIASETHSI